MCGPLKYSDDYLYNSIFLSVSLNAGVWVVQNQQERVQKLVFKEYKFEFCLICIIRL
jgi:hypothetical protein